MTGQRYGVYPEYKSSEGGWLTEIPAHWSASKLKYLANYFASNVGKKSKEGELPVELCNYTDVYYNDVVCSGLPFMKATATREQIDKFTLRAGDTIITKDSENPNDIAIPTFVEEDMPGVICGYHLSMIRPTPSMSPGFLNKTFHCAFARAYFATRSNGLTRYGLGGPALGSVVLPAPPLEEQKQIANFLDYETAKMDALIEKQQQLIALLQEKRQAVISHAVTKGLNPEQEGLPADASACAADRPMRDSGVEWLGDVPAHWTICKIKQVAKLESGHTPSRKVDEYWQDCQIPWVSLNDTGQLKAVDYISKTAICINEKGMANSSARELPAGCVVFTRDASIGLAAITARAMAVSQHIIAWVCDPMKVTSEYLLLVFYAMEEELERFTFGATLKTIGMPDVKRLTGAFPPLEEQARIVEHVFSAREYLSASIKKSEEMLEILAERRTALISAAVTGKIDVRGWKAPESKTEAEAP